MTDYDDYKLKGNLAKKSSTTTARPYHFFSGQRRLVLVYTSISERDTPLTSLEHRYIAMVAISGTYLAGDR